MPDKCYELHGTRVLECSPEGPVLRRDRDAVDLIAAGWKQKAGFVVIPVERLGDDFFRLKSRIAGEILQKFVQYRMRVAIAGDISRYLEESSSFRDFVYESNRAEEVWFVPSVDELGQRLERRAPEA